MRAMVRVEGQIQGGSPWRIPGWVESDPFPELVAAAQAHGVRLGLRAGDDVVSWTDGSRTPAGVDSATAPLGESGVMLVVEPGGVVDLAAWAERVGVAGAMRWLLIEREWLAAQLVEAKSMGRGDPQVAGLAHDLATAVGVALTAASVVGERLVGLKAAVHSEPLTRRGLLVLGEEIAVPLRLVDENLVRAVEVLRSFKQRSREEAALARETVDLGDMLRALVASLNPMLQELGLQVTVRAPEIRACIEVGALAQILANLLQNAGFHGYRGSGGAVDVSLEVQGSTAYLRVEDHGGGVSDEVLARLFDAYVTTRGGEGGTGLGLHSARRVARDQLGGDLRYEPNEGGGSVFVLSFPLEVSS